MTVPQLNLHPGQRSNSSHCLSIAESPTQLLETK